MQSHGEQDVLCPVFLVYLVAAHTEQARVPLETCAAEDACLLPQRHGGDGTARSTSTRRGGHAYTLKTGLDRFCTNSPSRAEDCCDDQAQYASPLCSSENLSSVLHRRYAVASALAASAVPSLVLARGHRIEAVPEIPLVVDDGAQTLTKTRKALDLLQRLGAAPGEHIMSSASLSLSGPSAESTLQSAWAGAAHLLCW